MRVRGKPAIETGPTLLEREASLALLNEYAAQAARATLVERGVEVAPVQDLGGVFYASFADPDGNTWTLQHMPWRQ